MEAAHTHSQGSRDCPYYAKPDRTKKQDRLKRIADEGVRALRTRYPDRDFRERSGKIAEFVARPSSRPSFERWHSIPNEDATIAE